MSSAGPSTADGIPPLARLAAASRFGAHAGAVPEGRSRRDAVGEGTRGGAKERTREGGRKREKERTREGFLIQLQSTRRKEKRRKEKRREEEEEEKRNRKRREESELKQ